MSQRFTRSDEARRAGWHSRRNRERVEHEYGTRRVRQRTRREEAEKRQKRSDHRDAVTQLRQLELRGHGHCEEAEWLREEIAA